MTIYQYSTNRTLPGRGKDESRTRGEEQKRNEGNDGKGDNDNDNTKERSAARFSVPFYLREGVEEPWSPPISHLGDVMLDLDPDAPWPRGRTPVLLT